MITFHQMIFYQRNSQASENYSCTSLLIDIQNDILQAADFGKATVLVLLDYSKAFDTIRHAIF